MRTRLLRILLLVLLLLVATVGLLATQARPAPDHPYFEGGVQVIAHQGGDGLRPSNTMAAFEHAVALGVDVLEMDIHSTQDGVIVTIHDATVDRTTNGTGRVQDLTFAELQALDAGYHWPTLAEEADRTDRPFRGQGITIPALEEILQAFPDMHMTIEIKQETPSLAEPFCALLRQYEMTDQVLVGSFREAALQEFRATCPEVPTSATESEVRNFFILNTVFLSALYTPNAYAFQVPESFGSIHLLSARFVQGAHARNMAVQPWTINQSEDMARLLALGVDGIITDYPDRLLDALGR